MRKGEDPDKGIKLKSPTIANTGLQRIRNRYR
jgi:hypothetical protein